MVKISLFRHVKHRETSEPHKDHWYTDSDKQLMETYIARHKDEYPLSLLEDLRKEAAYGCSDPRLHLRAREQADRLTEEAKKRLEDDFQTLSLVLTDWCGATWCFTILCSPSESCITVLGSWSDCSIVFGIRTIPIDPHHSFPWCSGNLGNWCRPRFNKCPLPEKFQKFEPHINYELNRDHEKIGYKPQFNNYNIKGCQGSWSICICELRVTGPYLKRSNSRHASMIIVTSWLLLVWEDGYVQQIAGNNTGEDGTRARYVSWAIFEISAPHSSKDVYVPCVFVCLSRRTRKYFQVARNLRRNSCMYVLGVYPFSSWRDRRRRK